MFVIGVVYNLGLCQFPSIDLNIEYSSKRGRRKQANMTLVTRKSTGPTNPALQSINLEHQISTIDEQQHDNQMEPISQQQENNVNNRLLIQPTSSITISRLNSKEAPKKRGLPPKINKNTNI